MYVAFPLTNGRNEAYRLRDIVGAAETDSIGVTALSVYSFEGVSATVYVALSFFDIVRRLNDAATT